MTLKKLKTFRKSIPMNFHEIKKLFMIVTDGTFPMTSGQGTKKLFSMTFEILGLANNENRQQLQLDFSHFRELAVP